MTRPHATQTNEAKSEILEYKDRIWSALVQCNVYRQEFNWLYKSPEGGQLKNQQPSKAPPPPQRKSARFLPIMEQRNVPRTFPKDIRSFHDFQSIHKEIYGY